MSAAAEPKLPSPGAAVDSACGGRLRFEGITPRSLFRGRWIYFCLPSCRETFEQDPKNSCLACNPFWEDPL